MTCSLGSRRTLPLQGFGPEAGLAETSMGQNSSAV